MYILITIDYIMYTQESWDKFYENYDGVLPWISVEHKRNSIKILTEVLGLNVEWKYILDYGCWNGHIWDYFLQLWADVDFADVSDIMVEKLKREKLYKSEIAGVVWSDMKKAGKVHVYKAEIPSDIPNKEFYDYIICIWVFPHIDPEMWKTFLDGLWDLLKKWWRLVVSWWDLTDEVLKEENYLWHVTWDFSWCINDLPKHLDLDAYEVEKSEVYDEKVPMFDKVRKWRYFAVKHKE